MQLFSVTLSIICRVNVANLIPLLPVYIFVVWILELQQAAMRRHMSVEYVQCLIHSKMMDKRGGYKMGGLKGKCVQGRGCMFI